MQYHTFFIIRRVILAASFVYLGNNTSFQVMIYMSTSVLNMMFIVAFLPFKEKLLSKQEAMNEIFLLSISFHLPLLTDYVDEDYTGFKNSIGWSMIVLTLVNLGVNLLISIAVTI